MTLNVPESEIPQFYRGYAAKLEGRSFMDQLVKAATDTPLFLEGIKDEQWDLAYAPGKWTLKEVIIHILDAERIFAYRALRFSRNDITELSGFEEDEYVPFCGARHRSAKSVIDEYKTVRAATLSLYQNMQPEMLLRIGKANNNSISVRAIGLAIAGHEMHHLQIIRERYLGEQA